MKVLLHICCAPCASACIPRLIEGGHSVALYFSNSNIATLDEFNKRLESAKVLAATDGVKLFIDEYDHSSWLNNAARGFENEREKGARCTRCFRFSLERAAKFAKENNFDAFTTSLTISPHKSTRVIFDEARACAEKYGIKFLEENFKKQDGFLQSVRRSCALNLYRQSFCGCEFSCK